MRFSLVCAQVSCEALIKYQPALSSHVVLGGSAVKLDVQLLRKQPPSVLIATPGRLNDLLHNHELEKVCRALHTSPGISPNLRLSSSPPYPVGLPHASDEAPPRTP